MHLRDFACRRAFFVFGVVEKGGVLRYNMEKMKRKVSQAMNEQNLGMITLLRSALNGERLALPEGFDWDKAMETIGTHHLTGLAMQGASLCGVPRTHPAVVKLTAAFCKGLQASRSQMKKLQEICALFDANGIDYMPVKGAIIKTLYPKAEYRVMGDADVLIRREQYPQIRQLLAAQQMQEDTESDYELTWVCPSLELELHTGLMPEYLGSHSEYYRDSWRFAQKNKTGNGYHLSPEDHFVYLLVHFAKHYLTSTICAKDICDFYVWRRAYPHMDEAYMRQELKKLHLDKFYDSILDLIGNWFEGKPATEATEMMTSSAFWGGVSQEHNEAAAKGTMKRYSNEGDALWKQKLKWFFRALFPAYHRMTYHYPVLKKVPILLPLFWVIHWFVALFKDRDRVKRGLVVMKLNEDGLTKYQEHLAAIGLKTDQAE